MSPNDPSPISSYGSPPPLASFAPPPHPPSQPRVATSLPHLLLSPPFFPISFAAVVWRFLIRCILLLTIYLVRLVLLRFRSILFGRIA